MIHKRIPLTLAALCAVSFAAPAPKAEAAKPKAKPAASTAAAPATPAAVTPTAQASPAAAPTAAPAAAPAVFATEKDKFSYVIGLDIGESLKQADYAFDIAHIAKGIQDMLSQDSTRILLNPEDRRLAIQQLSEQLQKARLTKDSLEGEKRATEAKAFLEKNKKVKGVITTASGLQYTYITKGKGASPKVGDEVTAHYAGSLLDGTEFDSSIKRGEPATFSLSHVIPGWQEMLPLMKVGDKVKCWIPAELGYGARGNAKIPGNSLLVFEIELIALPAAALAEPAATAAPAAPTQSPKPADTKATKPAAKAAETKPATKK